MRDEKWEGKRRWETGQKGEQGERDGAKSKDLAACSWMGAMTCPSQPSTPPLTSMQLPPHPAAAPTTHECQINIEPLPMVTSWCLLLQKEFKTSAQAAMQSEHARNDPGTTIQARTAVRVLV